jgi:3',5'-cyclic AMP phosphodiesterase CpdA
MTSAQPVLQRRPGSSSLCLVHLGDTHFGVEDRLATDAALVVIRGLAPDVVVASGDLTKNGRIAEFEAARDWLSWVPEPLILTPGNHDVPYWNVVLRLLAPFDRYRRYLAPLSEPTIDLPDVIVRAVNTARGVQPRLDWSKGAVDLDAIRLVADDMKSAGTALKVFVCHHPLVEPENVGVGGGVYRGEEAALILAEAGVDLILSGHVHNPFAVTLPHGDGCTYAVGTGTLSLRTRGTPASFSVIEADSASIRVTALGWTGTAFEPFLSWLLPRRRS